MFSAESFKRMTPVKGSVERTVLDKLIESKGKGITIFDFPEHLNITAELLDQAIRNLENNMFESECDEQIKFDA
jgi:hypothetical protein